MPTCRRHLIIGSLAVGAWAARPAWGAARRRVGLLMSAPPAAIYERLVARMRSLGWIESENVEYFFEWAPDEAGLRVRAAALAARRPEVVLASTEAAVVAAQRGIPGVPIVMAPSSDPIANGTVASLRRPGGRFTGTSWTQDAAIAGKYVELARELIPGLKRLGAVIDPAYPGIGIYRPPFDNTARRLGIEVRYADLTGADQIASAFESMRGAQAQAVFVFGSQVSYEQAGKIASAGTAVRLPTLHIWRHAAALGGTICYGPSWADLVVKGAVYVDKILRGANPADLPVEQPTVYELIVNLRAASAVGLKVPPALLARADEVIG